MRKLKKSVRTVGLTVFCAVVVIGLAQSSILDRFTIPHYQKLIEAGYSKAEIKALNGSKKDTAVLIDAPYYEDALERLTIDHYADLRDIGYTGEETRRILAAGDEILSFFVGQTAHPEWLDWIGTEDVIPDRLARYASYQSKHVDKDPDLVVRMVNANRDYPLYTHIAPADTAQGVLLLVNKYFQLDANYVPPLASATACGGFQMVPEAAESFNQLCLDMTDLDLDYQVSNTYRSYDTQSRIYANYLAKDPQSVVDGFSARPGHSEHQAGLAVDFKTKNSDLTFFESSDAYRWLIKNAHLYGFIQRYTKENETWTGYQAEAWHFRYVGKDVALKLFESQQSFDEYFALNLGQ